MATFIKQAIKTIILFLIGGLSYVMIEILYRGYSHPTMLILGGLCFLCCGAINELFSWEMPLLTQMGISAVIITVLELVAGLILNVWLGLGIWDYSSVPLNFMGQICLPFSFIWFLLSAPVIMLDDIIRCVLFGEEEPNYKIL